MSENVNHSVEQPRDPANSVIIKVFRFLLRLSVVALMGIVLGTAVYLGIPALYREFFQPVQINSRQIESLTEDLEGVMDDLSAQSAKIDEISALVEGRLSQQQETIAELSAKISLLEDTTLQLEASLATVNDLEEGVGEVNLNLENLQSDVDRLALKFEEIDTPAAEFSKDVQLVKAMELITHARFWLIQTNLGKAGEDIRLAKDVVVGVLDDSAGEERERLIPIVERLDQALLAIRVTPLVVTDDLEVVWQLLNLATEP